jgi:hypothetical protein
LRGKKDAMEEIDQLREHFKNRRQHAGFFEATGNNGPNQKQRKERSVVLDWLQTQFDEPELYVDCIQSCAQEPPDVAVHLENGTVLGVEVTELVDEKQVRENAPQKGAPNKYLTAKYRYFSGDGLRSAVLEIIEKKNAKSWQRFAPDSVSTKRILLIHSDERWIESKECENAFVSQEHFFEEIWLVMPSIPRTHDSISGKLCRSIFMGKSELSER